MTHFEARKPFDKLAALSRASGPAIQINIGPAQRNAGRDYFEYIGYCFIEFAMATWTTEKLNVTAAANPALAGNTAQK